MSMTNEKWLSDVAKTGEYKDLINKPTIVTDIDSDASENTLASSKSVKIVYDKAEEALNKANESKTKIATSLNSMGVATDENDTFDSLSEKIKTIKTGVNTDDATATADKILVGNSAYVKGQKVDGSMKNITASSNIMHTQGNATKVVLTDELFVADNTDGKRRVSLRYNGDNGFISSNTLFGMEESVVANKLGVTSNKIIKGQSICGVEGTVDLGPKCVTGDYVITSETRKFSRANGGYEDSYKVIIINNIKFKPKFISCWNDSNIPTGTIYSYKNDFFIPFHFPILVSGSATWDNYKLSSNSFAFENDTLMIPVIALPSEVWTYVIIG